MRNRLRVLERTFPCQRGQIIIEPIIENFVEEWANAQETNAPLPDSIDLAQRVIKAGVPVLTLAPLTSYLSQCKRDTRIPEPERLAETIIHGYLELRLKTTCPCGYAR